MNARFRVFVSPLLSTFFAETIIWFFGFELDDILSAIRRSVGVILHNFSIAMRKLVEHTVYLFCPGVQPDEICNDRYVSTKNFRNERLWLRSILLLPMFCQLDAFFEPNVRTFNLVRDGDESVKRSWH